MKNNEIKEIERLKNGYCELKVKCNNGECDCTNEEYDGMVEGNMKLSLEVERLNNIIEELEKMFVNDDKLIKEYNIEHPERPLDNYSKYYLDKLKELKENKI